MDARRAEGAVTGGLAAGAALSVMMLIGEALSGRPSELIELERNTAARLNLEPKAADQPATVPEQLLTHGGHLALSAVAGLAYASAVDDDADGARSGAVFGAAFFVAAYGLAGPLLGVTPWPWRQPPVRAVQHPVVHVLFGLAMARFAREAARR